MLLDRCNADIPTMGCLGIDVKLKGLIPASFRDQALKETAQWLRMNAAKF